MTLKVTWMFGQGQKGWTESLYLPDAALLTSTISTIDNLTAERAALLGNGVNIFNIRVSDVPADRLVTDLPLGTYTTGGNWGGDATSVAAVDANLALELEFRGPNSMKRTYLGGLPSRICASGPDRQDQYNPNGLQGWVAALNSYLAGINAGKWQARSQKGTQPVQAIGPPTLGTQSPPLIGISLPVSQNWTVGSKVLLSGWRRVNPRSPGLTGIWTLAGVPAAGQIGPPFIYYLLNSQNVLPNNFKTVGQIGLLVYIFETLGFTSTAKRITSRKRGGRLLLPLGRSFKVR